MHVEEKIVYTRRFRIHWPPARTVNDIVNVIGMRIHTRASGARAHTHTYTYTAVAANGTLFWFGFYTHIGIGFDFYREPILKP